MHSVNAYPAWEARDGGSGRVFGTNMMASFAYEIENHTQVSARVLLFEAFTFRSVIMIAVHLFEPEDSSMAFLYCIAYHSRIRIKY